ANQLSSTAQKTCMQQVISTLAPRAFRRPPTADETTELTTAFQDSGDFDTGLNDLLVALLMSPNFMYVSVVSSPSQDPSAVYALDPYQLASRLSYFLWQSMPDAELFSKAADATLLQPDVQKAQIARMIADPRSAPLLATMRDEYAGLLRLSLAP